MSGAGITSIATSSPCSAILLICDDALIEQSTVDVNCVTSCVKCGTWRHSQVCVVARPSEGHAAGNNSRAVGARAELRVHASR